MYENLSENLPVEDVNGSVCGNFISVTLIWSYFYVIETTGDVRQK